MQIAKYNVRWGKIKYIFISHLHGDHYFGLIGIITSMCLLGRQDNLHVYGPTKLKEIIELQLSVAETSIPFKLYFTALEEDGLIVNENKFTVSCFATQHRIPCRGFIIKEKKKPRKINKDTISKYQIPTAFYDRLKDGEDFTADGKIIRNEEVTLPTSPCRSYVYSADTIYDRKIAELASGANLLYHETTYVKTMTENALLRFHSTTHQAASIALEAGVEKLIIGHFSSKYEKLEVYLEEAKEVFSNSHLAIEGVTHIV